MNLSYVCASSSIAQACCLRGRNQLLISPVRLLNALNMKGQQGLRQTIHPVLTNALYALQTFNWLKRAGFIMQASNSIAKGPSHFRSP